MTGKVVVGDYSGQSWLCVVCCIEAVQPAVLEEFGALVCCSRGDISGD